MSVWPAWRSRSSSLSFSRKLLLFLYENLRCFRYQFPLSFMGPVPVKDLPVSCLRKRYGPIIRPEVEFHNRFSPVSSMYSGSSHLNTDRLCLKCGVLIQFVLLLQYSLRIYVSHLPAPARSQPDPGRKRFCHFFHEPVQFMTYFYGSRQWFFQKDGGMMKLRYSKNDLWNSRKV